MIRWTGLCLLMLGIQSSLAQTGSDANSQEELKLWQTEPAKDWTKALPIGNGRLGAMVYGCVDVERLQLNEDTLWTGGPHFQDNPEAYQYLEPVRELLQQGKYSEAEATAQKMLRTPEFGRPADQ